MKTLSLILLLGLPLFAGAAQDSRIGVIEDGSVTLRCPDWEYFVEPEFTVAVKYDLKVRQYEYQYTVRFSEERRRFMRFGVLNFGPANAATKLISFSGSLENCRVSGEPNAWGNSSFSCWIPWPGPARRGRTQEGRFTVRSALAPGVANFVASTFPGYLVVDDQQRKRLLPYFDNSAYILSEALEEAPAETCEVVNTVLNTQVVGANNPDDARRMTGLLLVPMHPPGSLTDARIHEVSVAELSTEMSRATEAMRITAAGQTLRIRDSVGVSWLSMPTQGVSAMSSAVRKAASSRDVPCNARGVIMEMLDGDKVVAQQGFRLIDLPQCEDKSGTWVLKLPQR